MYIIWQGVSLSSELSYAEIHCDLSQGQYENEKGREAQNVGRPKFALVQDGRRGMKDASSGTTSLVHEGDAWHRQGSTLQRMMSRASVPRQDELQFMVWDMHNAIFIIFTITLIDISSRSFLNCIDTKASVWNDDSLNSFVFGGNI